MKGESEAARERAVLKSAADETSSSSEEEEGAADFDDMSFMKLHKRYRILTNACILIVYIMSGQLFYIHRVRASYKASTSTSLYEITQIVTTIGYGDITIPLDDTLGHYFMIIYILVGIGVIANIMSYGVDYVISLEDSIFKNELETIQEGLHSSGIGAYSGRNQPLASKKKRSKFELGSLELVLAVAVLCLILMNVWALFYSYYESCSCSYDRYKEWNFPTCNETDAAGNFDQKQCEDTGGRKLDYSQGLYMAAVTFSTVGFGDFVPVTRVGRLVAVPFMFIGVGTFGLLVSTLSAWFHAKGSKNRGLKCKQKWFNKIDINGDGVIRRNEFRLFYLVKQGKIDIDDLDDIDHLFSIMDVSKDGKLTYDEIRDVLDDLKED